MEAKTLPQSINKKDFLQVLRWLAFLGTVDRADLTVLKLTKLNGTEWTELNAATIRGTGSEKHGPKNKNINLSI
jgi:hypothetical protein